MSVTSSAMLNRFIVSAQRDAGMSLDDAEDLGAFFTGVGDSMLEKLTPMLVAYRDKIKDTVRREVVEEIVMDLQTSSRGFGVGSNKQTVIERINSHAKRGNGNKAYGT